MKRKTHLIAAALFAVGGYLLLNAIPHIPYISTALLLDILLSVTILQSLIIFLPALAGAVLPDILDPPFTPHHRKYAHSKALLAIFIVFYFITLFYLTTADNIPITALHFLLLGYISHLLLDSLTPAGLW